MPRLRATLVAPLFSVTALSMGTTRIPTDSTSGIPLTLTLAAQSVVGGNQTTATITVGTPAPSGGTTVTITYPPGTNVLAGANQVGIIQPVGATHVGIPVGQTKVTVTIGTAGVAAQTTATFSVTSGTDVASANLAILPASVHAVTISPQSVTGGQNATMTIVLDGAAPSATGVDISIGHVKALASPVSAPSSVHLPPGASSVNATITTTPVEHDQSVSFSAAISGPGMLSTPLTVKAPVVTQLLLAPSAVVAGDTSFATLSLNAPAPSTGLSVPITTSRPGLAVGASVIVQASASSSTFPIATSVQSVGTTTVTAGPVGPFLGTGTTTSIPDGTSNTISLGETAPRTSATLTVQAPVLESFTARPTTAVGGANIIVSITLASSATTAHLVTLSTDRPDVIQIPPPFNLSPSPVPTPITLKTQPVTAAATATVTAASGVQKISVTVTITPSPQ